MDFKPVIDPEIDIEPTFTPFWILESACYELMDRIRNDGYLKFHQALEYMDEIVESFNCSGFANNIEKIRLIEKLNSLLDEYFENGERVLIDCVGLDKYL